MVRLAEIDSSAKGKHDSRKDAQCELDAQLERLDALQYLLYADASRSLLVVLQGLDAAGKDGTVRHIFRGMNPQGTSVFSFKEPTPRELAHDFLWRVHKRTPQKGEVTVFNRSHYEDVLVVRVHGLVPEPVWSKRYALINDFERNLVESGTQILKFFLHISPDEQLARFKSRLDDKARNWKISESDYSERKLWPQYMEAYDEALSRTSTEHAPWFVIPSDHKWFRNLAISKIIADTLDGMNLKLPAPRVDLRDIRRKYHAAQGDARRRQEPQHMLKAGDHVYIDGTNEEGTVKEVHAHEVTVRVKVAGGHEERKYAYESVRIDPTMSEASGFIDH